jgi:hypothetical protein
MASKRDHEGNELSHLMNAYPISGKAVHEIGCGDGKLTASIQAYQAISSESIHVWPTCRRRGLKGCQGDCILSRPRVKATFY